MHLRTTEKINNKKLSIAIDVLLALMLGSACFYVFITMFSLKWPGAGMFSGSISGGLAGIWDKIADKLGNLDYVILPRYKASTSSGGAPVYGTALTMILLFFSVISYFIIKSRTRLLLLIFAAPLAIMMLTLGVGPSVFAGGVFAAAVIITLAVMRMDTEIDPKSLMVPLAIVVAAGVVLAAAESTVSLREPSELASFGESVKATIDKARYGTDPLPQGDIGSISGKELKASRGDIESVKETLGTTSPYGSDYLFGEDDSFYDEEESSDSNEKKSGAGSKTALTVKMSTPASYYLRGFVGGTYSRNKWSMLSNSTFYGMRDTVFWLNRRGFDGLSQMSRAAELGGSEGSSGTSDFSDVFGDSADDGSTSLDDDLEEDDEDVGDDEDEDDDTDDNKAGSLNLDGTVTDPAQNSTGDGSAFDTVSAIGIAEPVYAYEGNKQNSASGTSGYGTGTDTDTDDPFADSSNNSGSSDDPFADGSGSSGSSDDPFADSDSSDTGITSGNDPYADTYNGDDASGSVGDEAGDGYGITEDGASGTSGEDAYNSGVDEEYEAANEISVKVKGASRRFAFVPYELSLRTAPGKKPRKSEMILPKGTKNYGGSHLGTEGFGGKSKYTYKSAENITGSWTDAVGKLYTAAQTEGIQNYFLSESHYNVMQYENYLDLPNKYKSLFSAEIGSPGDLTEDHADYKETIEKISNYLSGSYIYSESFSKPEGKEDLVEKFVESKSGCDMHFATLATLMFRYYGIPARYVEGYLITPHMIEGQTGASDIDVTRQSNHAWTEIYIDGFGWVPFEATPEYSGIMQEADMSKGLQNVEYENKPPVPDEPEEDEFDDEDDGNDARLGKKLIKLFIILIILLILALLIYIAVKYGRRIMEEKRWKKLFEDKNPGTAIKALYQYSLNHGWELSDDARKLGLAASYSQAEMTEADRKFMRAEFDKAKAKAAEEKKKNKEIARREKAAAKAAAKQEKAAAKAAAKEEKAAAKAAAKEEKAAAIAAAKEEKAAAESTAEEIEAASIEMEEQEQEMPVQGSVDDLADVSVDDSADGSAGMQQVDAAPMQQENEEND